MTELLNVVRLMFSRLGAHVCPNGHRIVPNLARSALEWIDCPVCGVHFAHPSAESFSFNTLGRPLTRARLSRRRAPQDRLSSRITRGGT
jgi:excinuclease ABC subunit A